MICYCLLGFARIFCTRQGSSEVGILLGRYVLKQNTQTNKPASKQASKQTNSTTQNQLFKMVWRVTRCFFNCGLEGQSPGDVFTINCFGSTYRGRMNHNPHHHQNCPTIFWPGFCQLQEDGLQTKTSIHTQTNKTQRVTEENNNQTFPATIHDMSRKFHELSWTCPCNFHWFSIRFPNELQVNYQEQMFNIFVGGNGSFTSTWVDE